MPKHDRETAPLMDEIERLRAELRLSNAKANFEWGRDRGYRAGAEAMRERAAKRVEPYDETFADMIRALPIKNL